MSRGASRAALCYSTEPIANMQPAAMAAITATTTGQLLTDFALCLPCRIVRVDGRRHVGEALMTFRKGPQLVVLLLSFAASLCFAASYVLQYHEAHEAPRGLFLSPRLLVELAHHRIWVGGIAAMMVGNGLQAWALGRGSLAVVEPVLVCSLLFALPLSAAWRRERLRPV